MIVISASFLNPYERESTRVEIAQDPSSPLINIRFRLEDGEIFIKTNKHYAKILRDQLTEAIKFKPITVGNETVKEDSALVDVKEGRTKSFKNTDDLFKDLDGEESALKNHQETEK